MTFDQKCKIIAVYEDQIRNVFCYGCLIALILALSKALLPRLHLPLLL